jgi:hypothetical protein
MIDLVVRVIITLLLAALDTIGPTEPAKPPPGNAPDGANAVPVAPGRQHTAAVFALLRAVDPCALHDIAAATKVTGDHADQILPVGTLTTCQLRLHHEPQHPSWIFTTRVGIPYGTAQRDSAAAEELDGRRVYRDESLDPHARSCTYTRPLAGEIGISLTATAPMGQPGARPCPIARAYLTTAGSLTRLVLRAEHRTHPAFALAAVDPCAAARAVLPHLATSGTAHPDSPSDCRVQPDTNPDLAVDIGFGFGTDPTGLAGASTNHLPVTVAGHPGVALAEPDGRRCQVTLAYDTATAIDLDTRWVQTVTVTAAGSCQQATTIAALVVGAIPTQ